MARPKGGSNKKRTDLTITNDMNKKEKQSIYVARWRERKKSKEEAKKLATWAESSSHTIPNSAIPLDGAADRDEKGKFLPGHKATRNVRNPFKKMLDSIILDDPNNLHKYRLTIVKLLTKSSEGDLQATQILLKYLMPGIAEHGLETIKRLNTSTAEELSQSMDQVIANMADGELSPEGAISYLKCLSMKRDFMQSAFMEVKLEEIEKRLLAAGK